MLFHIINKEIDNEGEESSTKLIDETISECLSSKFSEDESAIYSDHDENVQNFEGRERTNHETERILSR